MGVIRTILLVSALVTAVSVAPPRSADHAAPSNRAAVSAQEAELPTPVATSPSDEQRAQRLLANLAKHYRYLDGVTVRFGTTPRAEEAVSFYMDGDILVSDAHTVGVDEILAHEIWHVIDWRDNGRIDWGEDLPPKNASDYLR